MNYEQLTGMAIQAFVTAALWRWKVITVSPGQQFVAGILFSILAAIAYTNKG